MRALVYDPYADTLGGGERYVLTFILALIKMGYEVDLAWKDDGVISEAARRFDLDLSAVKIDPGAYQDLSLSAGLLARYRRTKNYDLIFWVSDGSLPYLFGRKNYIHFQVPFKKIGGNPINNFLKTQRTKKSSITLSLPSESSILSYPSPQVSFYTPNRHGQF